MLKRAAKVFGFLLVVTASIGSFIYINSANSSLNISEGIGFEQPDLLPEEPSVATPAIAVAKKAIILAKCFLYPSE